MITQKVNTAENLVGFICGGRENQVYKGIVRRPQNLKKMSNNFFEITYLVMSKQRG